MRLKAILFDVDGTLAETEEAHRTAFNGSFADAGLDWSWSQDAYRALLTTTGGRERIARYMAERALPLDSTRIAALHSAKNRIYAELVANGAVAPRPGVVALIEEARAAGVVLAIATTTSRANLAALLQHAFGENAASWFAVIVAGEDVTKKKPDPEVYTRALTGLALAPRECVAIEDSRNGLLAARAAGIAIIVTPSHYTAHEDFSGAALVRPSLAGSPDRVDLALVERLLDESI